MANFDEEQKSNKVTRRGLLLKESREIKGLSIETVHEMTKIPLDILHAIEEGYTVRMVSTYYFKGFIKMYAKFLGIEPGLVLDEPLPEKSTTDQPLSVVSDPEHRKFNEYIIRQNKKQTKIGLGLLVVIVGIILFAFFALSARFNGASGISVSAAKKDMSSKKMLAAQIANRKLVEQTKSRMKNEARVEKKEVSHAAVSVEPLPVDDIQDVSAEHLKAPAMKKVTLSIKSRATGWLQVKVDGNMVLQSTLRAGAVESWQADKTIELSGKNINNLEFEVNGKTLGQLSKSDRGARRVVITREGLTVKN